MLINRRKASKLSPINANSSEQFSLFRPVLFFCTLVYDYYSQKEHLTHQFEKINTIVMHPIPSGFNNRFVVYCQKFHSKLWHFRSLKVIGALISPSNFEYRLLKFKENVLSGLAISFSKRVGFNLNTSNLFHCSIYI